LSPPSFPALSAFHLSSLAPSFDHSPRMLGREGGAGEREVRRREGGTV
jgi:hypothetical protein